MSYFRAKFKVKLKKYLANTVCLGLMIINFACQPPEAIDDPNQEEERLVMTKIVLSNDFEIQSEITPTVSKNTDNDLYAIQIYEAESGNPSYKAFAYGLFDNVDNIEIELSSIKQYKFVVGLVPNGKNLIKQKENAYYEPFTVSLNPTAVSNAFTKTADAYFGDLYEGRANVMRSNGLFKAVDRPSIDRYAGEVVGYKAKDGAKLDILLKRVVFGLTLIPVGLSEGYVELSLDKGDPIQLYANQTSETKIYSMLGAWNANIWINDDYSEEVVCKVKWVNNKNSVVIGPIKGKVVNVKRNSNPQITVSISGPKQGVSFTRESDAWKEKPEVIF